MEFYSSIYLENAKLAVDKFLLIIIILISLAIMFLLFRWIKGSVTLKEKQLSIIGLILVSLFGLTKLNEYSIANDSEKTYKNTASVIKKLSEKLNVKEEEIYVNTKEITEHTVYKIKDDFYQIHWVNNTILVEKMTVPYVDDIKIINK